MNRPNKERFKTSVGGQALMEGIMMRGPKKICCAVRKPCLLYTSHSSPAASHPGWPRRSRGRQRRSGTSSAGAAARLRILTPGSCSGW